MDADQVFVRLGYGDGTSSQDEVLRIIGGLNNCSHDARNGGGFHG